MRILESLVQDVRVGVRVLFKNPGFSAVAVLVLTLGIGANSAIFSLVNLLLFRPLPVAQPAALVGVFDRDTEPPGAYRTFSYPNYRDLRETVTGFSDLAAFSFAMVGLEEGDTTRRVIAFPVSSNYFETFGNTIAVGRGFRLEEERPGADARVVVVSHDYWERRGRDPDVLGGTLRINGEPYTVIGIGREGFVGTSIVLGPEFWLPLSAFAAVADDLMTGSEDVDLHDRRRGQFNLVGRLAPGRTAKSVQPELEAIAARLADAFPAANDGRTFLSAPLSRVSISTSPQTDTEVRALAMLLSAMATVVLLIACLNLANMLLARGAARRKEIAVRRSLGGGRVRIVRQLLTEGLLLSLIGGAFGLVIAQWAMGLLIASIEPLLPFRASLQGIGIDGRVLAGTFGFSVLATLFFGLGPAWRLTRTDLVTSLKQTVGEIGGSRRRLLTGRNLLVLSQIALSLVLITSGGLFYRGAATAATADPGFSMEEGLLLQIDPTLVGYDDNRGQQVYRRVLERLRALPGVAAVGAASLLPFSGISEGQSLRPMENGSDAETARTTASYSVITPDYFAALGLPILQGRDFSDAEITHDASPAVVIIDEPLVRRFWPDGDALGEYVQFYRRATEDFAPPRQVIGIVPGLRQTIISQGPVPHVYVPFGDPYRSDMTVHLRATTGGPDAEAALITAVRDAVTGVDPRVPVLALKTLRDHRAGSIDLWIVRAGARLFGTFGALALLLAVIGIYGVKAYVVARRTREVGIRLALGATAAEVLWLLVRDGLVLTALGLGIGIGIAALTAQALETVLIEVSALDPLVFLAAPLLLAAAALLASYVPARRATKVTPMAALRYE